MTISVLIVDDSRFICKLIRDILEEETDFKIVGVAHNGQEAIVKAAALTPDVITMDIEMPIMDGIEAVKRIMATTPTSILMFSSLTYLGAKATLEALNAGAIDFLPKKLKDLNDNLIQAKSIIKQRIRLLSAVTPALMRHSIRAGVSPPKLASALSSAYTIEEAPTAAFSTHKPYFSTATLANSASTLWQRIQVLVIVASTGGPVAIETILTQLPASCPVPILIIQHMPANFTASFAERLNNLCHIQVKQAEQGDVLRPGLALLAPGGQQMEIAAVAGHYKIELRAKEADELYAPSADITLKSVAQYFADQSLSIILTGMGADGREGATKLKEAGAMVWAQNKASSTIYGMPKAIIEARLADKIYALQEIADELAKIA